MKKKGFLFVLLIVLTIILMIPAMAFAAVEGEAADSSFFTWAMLGTYAGCLAATLIVTQFTKPLWPQKWKTQFLSYIVAVAILILANWFLGTLDAQSAVICVLNAIVIALAANGGYSNIKEVVEAVNGRNVDLE